MARYSKLKILFMAAVIGLSTMIPHSGAYSATEPFDRGWLELLREQVAREAPEVPEATIRRLLPDTLQPLETVEQQSKAQPEKKNTLAEYLSKRVTPYRIEKGRGMMEDNQQLLGDIEKDYKIPPQLIMAILGMETSFCTNTGNVDVISALVTVARSRPDYRREVIEAIKMINEGYGEIETEKGSWAGAFGCPQFIPSSFRRLAKGYHHEGHINVWTDLKDIFASTANHLHESGWRYGERWGRPVSLPAGFDLALLTDLKKERISHSKTLREWAELGVRLPGGGALPQDYDKPVTIIAPNFNPKTDTEIQGPVFVVYDNFWAIIEYNSSYKYSLAVNMLADAIGKPPARQAR